MFKEPKSPHSHWVASLFFSHFGLRSVMCSFRHKTICRYVVCVCVCVDANVLHRSQTDRTLHRKWVFFIYYLGWMCESLHVCTGVRERWCIYDSQAGVCTVITINRAMAFSPYDFLVCFEVSCEPQSCEIQKVFKYSIQKIQGAYEPPWCYHQFYA